MSTATKLAVAGDRGCSFLVPHMQPPDGLAVQVAVDGMYVYAVADRVD
jgi:hypothetical protein